MPKTNTRKVKISVITPTFNRKDCVMDAVNSVLRQSADFFDYEIIVSDDGSTDGTGSLFKKYGKAKNGKIKYFFWKKNGGVNVARNKAIKKATGDLILLLDSDDLLTDDAFKVIAREYNNLGNINFFGTISKNKNKKMYRIEKPGRYDYKEWLGGEKIRGEFLSLMKKEVFDKDMFDEERFCFESFFWNRVIKKYGVTAFDKPLRIYSFEQENRVSKKLQDPKKSLKRYSDYLEYLRRFEADYRKYGLHRQLSSIFFSIGYYACLSGNMKSGREYFQKGNREKFSAKNTAGIILSRFGQQAFIRLARIISSKP